MLLSSHAVELAPLARLPLCVLGYDGGQVGAEAKVERGAAPRVDPLAELVEPAVAGDRAALRRLLEVLAPYVLRTVRGVLGKDAPDVDDIAQDSLTAIVDALAAFRGGSSLKHYANRITVRTALRAQKKAVKGQQRLGELSEQGAPRGDDGADPDAHVEARKRAACLRDLLAALPEPQAEAMTMRLVLGYDLPEISEATGATINTVRSRVRLGREKLRSLIEADPRARAILGVES